MTTDTLQYPALDDAPEVSAPARPAAPAKPSAIADSIAVVQGEVAKFDQIESGLRAIETAHPKDVIVANIETPAGMKVAEAGWRAYRNPRLEVEKARRSAKAPVLSLGKSIDNFAGDLETRLRSGEDHYKAQIDAEETRRAAEKAEAKRLDDERIAKHQANIAAIRSFLGYSQGLPAARIALGIERLQGQVYGEDWQEFAVPAANAQCETLEAMRTLHAQTVEREAEAARLEAQREEQARVAAEQAEAARRLDEQRAELARQQRAAADNLVRVTGLQGRIAEIRAAATGHERATAADLAEAITAVTALDVSDGQFQEFACLADHAKGQTLTVLKLAHFEAVLREDAAEAERLARIPLALPTPPEPLCGECGATPEGDRGPADLLAAPFDYSAGEPQAIEAPEALPEPTLTLGAINERIAPLSISGAGLALLGFEPAGRRKAAVLFHESDWPAMRAAMVKHLDGSA